MGALKPRTEGMKEKFRMTPATTDGNDEAVPRVRREPLGGCANGPSNADLVCVVSFFPRFHRVSTEVFFGRTTWSSYDVFLTLPFELPFNMGAHISLFTLLWAITTPIYTYYNTRHMDMSNPAINTCSTSCRSCSSLGFFNTFASGLTLLSALQQPLQHYADHCYEELHHR